MNHCETCRHWDKNGPRTDGHESQRRCNSPKNGDLAGEEGAGVVNGEPYGGGVLATGPRFGCIHYKPRKHPLLRCHDCGATFRRPDNCPNCGELGRVCI